MKEQAALVGVNGRLLKEVTKIKGEVIEKSPLTELVRNLFCIWKHPQG